MPSCSKFWPDRRLDRSSFGLKPVDPSVGCPADCLVEQAAKSIRSSHSLFTPRLDRPVPSVSITSRKHVNKPILEFFVLCMRVDRLTHRRFDRRSFILFCLTLSTINLSFPLLNTPTFVSVSRSGRVCSTPAALGLCGPASLSDLASAALSPVGYSLFPLDLPFDGVLTCPPSAPSCPANLRLNRVCFAGCTACADTNRPQLRLKPVSIRPQTSIKSASNRS
ncbi:unnamed protein product [Protopolystoma xenopodis]|uniref:Uncharacterized protein n=1 Tax=Protopolystoma xenopodis TaxID=117903 RepID=A0A3S5BYC5_9PLAT|nr:unnamed protein product [Protopolystoma xenopodis]